MNLTLNLVACDLRYLRHYLGLWLGLVVLQAGLVGYAPHLSPFERGHVFSLSSFAWLVAVLKICLLAVIVAQLVQKDCTVGSTAFWLSRPISKSRLLASKSLFLVLAVVLPTLMVEVVLLRVGGVTPEDTLRSIPQIVLLTLFTIVVFMMLAVLTTTLPRQILLGIIALVAVPPLSYVLFLNFFTPFSLVLGTWLNSGEDLRVAMPIPPPSFPLQVLGMLPVLLGTAGIVVGHQYLTRRTMRSRILLLSAVSLTLLSMGFWRWDLWATPPQLDKKILDPAQVTARIEKKSLLFDPLTSSHPFIDLMGEKKMLLRGSIELDDLPPDLVTIPAQISANLLLPSGESVAHHVSHSMYTFTAMSPTYRNLRDEKARAQSLRQALGEIAFLDVERVDSRPPPELFAIREDLYERYRDVPLQYWAQVDCLVQRDEITAIRLDKRARYDRGSNHVEILSVNYQFHTGENTWIELDKRAWRDRGSDQVEIPSMDRSYGRGLRVHLSESAHKLIIDRRNAITYLLINPSRREAVFGRIGYIGGSSLYVPPLLSFVFPMLKVQKQLIDFGPGSGGPPLDPTWMDGAELIRVETTNLGWFSKSIRVEDFVMEGIARSPAALSQPGKDG